MTGGARRRRREQEGRRQSQRRQREQGRDPPLAARRQRDRGGEAELGEGQGAERELHRLDQRQAPEEGESPATTRQQAIA